MPLPAMTRARANDHGLSGLAQSYLRDLNAPAAWAGITTFIWYAVGLVPVQIAVTGQFGLSSPEVTSWIFIIWFTGAVSSIALSLVYRQPIPITSTIPGLIFLGTMAGQYSFPELVGANVMAGVTILALGLLGIGGRLLKWLPMPLAMGMLAGSILSDVSHMVTATVENGLIAGVTVAGFGVGRLIRTQKLPPIALALVSGALAVLLTHDTSPAPISWSLPSLVVPHVQLTLPAFIAVSLPLVVLSLGLGNVQGLGFLVAQGYKVPVNRVTIVLGLTSLVNAVFGGHTAIISRNGMPIMAGPEAGPREGRYWANLISAALTILIALAARPVASLVLVLPSGYVIALAGLAILPSFQNALEKAFGDKLRFGAVTAFVVAATPFSLLGISSAFWALVVALVASLVGEREELLAHWRHGDTPKHERAEERADMPRLPVILQPARIVRIAHNGHRSVIAASISNLSAGGLKVSALRPLADGDQLELAFSLPGEGAELRVRAEVRHVSVRQDELFETWEAGCVFQARDELVRNRILHFIAAHPSLTRGHAAAIDERDQEDRPRHIRPQNAPRQLRGRPVRLPDPPVAPVADELADPDRLDEAS